MTKKIVFTLIVASLLTAPKEAWAINQTSPSAALDSQINLYKNQVFESLQSYKQAVGEQKKTQLKNYGTRSINLRLRWIEKAKNLIQTANVGEEMKQTLVTDLENNFAGLSSLKGKVEAGTDLETLKNDVRGIFLDYRIFLVVLPRDHGRLAGARLTVLAQKGADYGAKLDEIGLKLKNQGLDTVSIDSLISDFKTQFSEAQSNIQAADDQFSQMSPSDTEGARVKLQTGREFLSAAIDNFKAARETLQKIKVEVKNLRDGLAG